MTSTILPLEVKDLVIRKRGKTILDRISLDIEPAGFTIVMGPNGSGKTTLLRSLHGLEKVRVGSIEWRCPSAKAAARQSFVFQTPVLLRRSVLDNLTYPLLVRGMNKKKARENALKSISSVGLSGNAEAEANNLSGGEKQKLAIARALVTEPEVLFLDEPTTNLDGNSTKEIEDILLLAYQQGTRIIMATHDLGQAKRLASDIVFLNRGRLCEHTSAKVFFKTPASPSAAAYLRGDIVA